MFFPPYMSLPWPNANGNLCWMIFWGSFSIEEIGFKGKVSSKEILKISNELFLKSLLGFGKILVTHSPSWFFHHIFSPIWHHDPMLMENKDGWFFLGSFLLRKWNMKKGSSIELFQNISQNFVKNPSCASLTILWLPFSLVYFPTWSLSLSLSTTCCFSCFGDRV